MRARCDDFDWMLHAQYGRCLLFTFVGSVGCSYDFGGGIGDGGSGGSTSSFVFATTSSKAATNAVAASTTGNASDVLPDCGGFQDDFTTSLAWTTDFAEVSGGRADTMPGTWQWYATERTYGGELLSIQTFSMSDCFVSVRVESAAPDGFTLFAIEDGNDRERAFQIEIDQEHEGDGEVRGVGYYVYAPPAEDYQSTFARIEGLTHVGLWVDDASGRLRAYARQGDGSWVFLGAKSIPPYTGAARFNMGSYGLYPSESGLASFFDDFNVLAVTRTELEMAQQPVPIEQQGSEEPPGVD